MKGHLLFGPDLGDHTQELLSDSRLAEDRLSPGNVCRYERREAVFRESSPDTHALKIALRGGLSKDRVAQVSLRG